MFVAGIGGNRACKDHRRLFVIALAGGNLRCLERDRRIARSCLEMLEEQFQRVILAPVRLRLLSLLHGRLLRLHRCDHHNRHN